jgi:hypothetical protein
LFICHPMVILLEMQGRWPNLIFQLRVPPFEKPEDSVNHFKPLQVKGHINGTPITCWWIAEQL